MNEHITNTHARIHAALTVSHTQALRAPTQAQDKTSAHTQKLRHKLPQTHEDMATHEDMSKKQVEEVEVEDK